MEQKKVQIYTSTTCPYCEMAKDYFRTKGIKYEEMSTTEPENRKNLVSKGIRGVPAIFIGDKYVVGFDPEEIEKLLADPSADPESAVIEQDIIPPNVEPVVPTEDAAQVEPPKPNVPDESVHNEVNQPIIEEVKKEDKSMTKYVCTVCGYVYDPAVGDVDNGIAAGTSFADLPEDWVCPLCGVAKDMFEEE